MGRLSLHTILKICHELPKLIQWISPPGRGGILSYWAFSSYRTLSKVSGARIGQYKWDNSFINLLVHERWIHGLRCSAKPYTRHTHEIVTSHLWATKVNYLRVEFRIHSQNSHGNPFIPKDYNLPNCRRPNYSTSNIHTWFGTTPAAHPCSLGVVSSVPLCNSPHLSTCLLVAVYKYRTHSPMDYLFTWFSQS